jgi:hypothetical protein
VAANSRITYALPAPLQDMLQIRQAQWNVLSAVETKNFESLMAEHLHHFFPRQFKATGEAAVYELIRTGIRLAASHDIKNRRDVCKYIDLMVVLGLHFDLDPRFPWVAEVLNRKQDSNLRMRSLIEHAKYHLTRDM